VTRSTPYYPLSDVQALAKARDRCIILRRALRESRELGFTLDQALEVITWLTPNEYDRSLRYIDSDVIWDVYIVPDQLLPSRRKLYIKLRIPSPSMVHQLVVTSFHDEDVFTENEDSTFHGN